MDSKMTVSIFFFLFCFYESYARNLDYVSLLTSPSPSPSPAAPPTPEGCRFQSMRCHNQSLTACIDRYSTASKQLLLYVKNEGESSLRVNVTVSHAKHIIQYLQIELPGHQFSKVNISASLGRKSSIKLDSGKFGCEIYIKSSVSGGRTWWTDISPFNGAFILFITGLIMVGGIRACCCNQGRRIPYQVLETGQPGSPSANKIKTADSLRTRLQR